MAHTKTRSFARYLRQLQEKHFDSVNDMAEALGVHPTHLSRAMGTNSRSFDIHGLFKLAEVTGEHPFDVLHAAGKGDIADLIKQYFGKPTPQREMSAKLREVSRLWETVEANAQVNDGGTVMLFVLWLLRSHCEGISPQRPAARAGHPRPVAGRV